MSTSMIDASVEAGVPDLGALFAEHEPRILNWLRSWVGDPDDAQDLMQDSFLNAWRARDTIDPTRPVGAWLWTIAKNLASRHHRRRGLVSFEPISEAAPYTLPVDHETPERHAERQEDRALVHRVLPLLPRPYVVALVLRYGHDLGAVDQATRLGTNRHTAAARLRRARDAFRQAVTGFGAPPPTVDVAEARRVLGALRELLRPDGRLPGRKQVCRETGLSEVAYGRALAHLVARGIVVDRSSRCAGRLADSGESDGRLDVA